MAHDLAKYGDQEVGISLCSVGVHVWHRNLGSVCVFVCLCKYSEGYIFSMFLPGCILTC